MSNRKLARTLFIGATFLYWIALYLYVPTLPTYIYKQTLNLAVVGTVLSMYGLWQALVRIPIGIAVDKTGRGKPFILIFILFTTAGALTMGFSKTVGILTVGRAMTGLAAGTWVPLVAVFSSLFPPAQAVFATSLLTFSGTIGRLIATSLNGFLNELGGYELAFILAAASGVLACAIIFATRVQKGEAHEVSGSSIVKLFKRTDIMLPSVISLVGQTGTWAVTFGFLPLFAQELGASDVVKGLIVSLNLVAMMAGNLLNTLITKKVRHVLILSVSVTSFAAGIFVLTIAQQLWVVFAATALMGFSNGFSYPTLMGLSIKDVDQSHRTSAVGIHQSVYAIGMFAGPWLGGIIADAFGIRRMFGVVAGFVLIVSYVLIAIYSGRIKFASNTAGTPSKR